MTIQNYLVTGVIISSNIVFLHMQLYLYVLTTHKFISIQQFNLHRPVFEGIKCGTVVVKS